MTKFFIPDMSCGHCQSSIEKALAPLYGDTSILVSVADRSLTMTPDIDPQPVIDCLAQIGFAATPEKQA